MMSQNGDWDDTKWAVGLSNTEVLATGTKLSVKWHKGGDYFIKIKSAGSCPPVTDEVRAHEDKNGRLVSDPFAVQCQPADQKYYLTMTHLDANNIGGAVAPEGSSFVSRRRDVGEGTNGDPAGTYTAEEEGGAMEDEG